MSDNEMEMPDFDGVREAGRLVPQDEWQDVSLINLVFGHSKNKGTPGLTYSLVVDNDLFAGTKLEDTFWIDGKDAYGWRQMKSMCVAAGFKWTPTRDMEKLALQFIDHDKPLRFSVLIEYSYSAKIGGTTKYNLKKEEYDEVKAQGGTAYINLKVRDFRPPSAVPDLTLLTKARQPVEDDASPGGEFTGDSDKDDDDDLPF